MVGLGEAAGLTAALMWTFSSMLWGRIKLTALTLNFFKNLIGVVLILTHLAIVRIVLGLDLFQASTESWIWLGISGLIGVVIGDTFYFRSLQIIGPRLALMVSTTAPLFSVLLTSFVLNDRLSQTAIFGVLLTVVGVVIVVMEKKTKDESPGIMPGNFRMGALFGVLGAICQALGGVFAKKGMTNLSTGEFICDPIEATMIRLLVSAIGTTVVILLMGKLGRSLKLGIQKENLGLLIPATAIGTWLGIWLSQIAYQGTNVAIAQTLLATCPLFAIPVVWWLQGIKPTITALGGTLVALLGVYLAVA
ncbi:MAG: DMT family transporter [Planctomycetota bacterium]